MTGSKMVQRVSSIRPFIGAKNFAESRRFYSDLGFEEKVLSANLSLFVMHGAAFYLQDAYVKDWVDNSQVFVEVEDAQQFWTWLQSLDLSGKYSGVRLVPLRQLDWGKECFVHDPSGILWHFGEFKK
jgi:catechol 2,3-dioxygenase-like lactoylglutathione lyase family enzyme